MSTQAELSPNVPDIVPDYVDLDTRPAAPETRAVAEPEAREARGRVDLDCVHALNAEALPPAGEAGDGEFQPDLSGFVPEGDFAAFEPEPDYLEEDSEMAMPIPDRGPVAAGHREGECVPNTPDVAPEFVAPEALRPAGLAAAQSGQEEKAPNPKWLRWSYAAAALVAAAFGIMVCNQAITSLALVSTLPAWGQWLLMVPLVACCATVAVVCGSVVRAWLKLRQNRQIKMSALEELRRRAQTRKDGVEHFQAARLELEKYLATYPLDEEGVAKLRAAGVGAEHLAKLSRQRDYLMERITDSRSWLGEFRDLFQGGLDKAASARVRSWSLKAAGCVIASPLPLLDAALVLGIVMKMIGDLCRIYNVRSGKASSLILLSKAIAVAFIAGVADEAAGMASEFAGEELTGVLGDTALGVLGAGAARVIAPKLGEGAINAFFVMRLGKATIRLLQPLRQ